MKIGILENDPLLGATLIDYINIGLGHEVEFCIGSIAELKKIYISSAPDLLLLDINLNDIKGIDTVKTVRSLLPAVKIIVITGDMEKKFVFDCIEHGAKGFLYKPFNLEKLKDAVELVCGHGNYLDGASLSELITKLQHPADTYENKILRTLTSKEQVVFYELKSGKSTKQIADALKVSNNTVNFHLKNIYNKAEVHSRSELMSKILPAKSN